ncbi:MAG: hypothetical protein QOE36_944 [Gaiellaceae bacterium]|nr:hypothetical protein [Gaiellaceae bacterium]
MTEKYAETATPHVRMSRRVVDPARLRFVDAVASSHGHTDHLDPVTLRAVAPAALVCPAGTCALARERAGVEPLPIEEGKTVVVAGFELTAVHAEHDAPGGAVGYVVRCGPWTLYHSGDTLAYDGLGAALRPFSPDVAILPINGALGNMTGREAANIAREAGAALAIPCHYDMFEFNTASPDEFLAECERLGQAPRVLRAGERLTLASD